MSVAFGDAPKSILRPPTGTSTTPRRPSPAEAHRIALTHASTLQIRKALEASILNSLILLLDFPSSSSSGSAIRAFKYHLRFFTPLDYDSLLEERNVVSLCGYTLCGNSPYRSGATSRLTHVSGGRWVERKKVERFCSADCARKAMWVRVQLSAEPAWVRRGAVDGVEVDGCTGEVRGIDLDSEEPDEGWDEAACGLRLLEEAEEAREKGVWCEINKSDLKKLVQELEGVGIRDAGLGKVGDGKEGELKKKMRDTEPPLLDVVERKPGKKVAITLPVGGTAAIEGYVPKGE